MGKKGKSKKKTGGRERHQKTQSPPKSVQAQENFNNNNLNEQDKQAALKAKIK